MSWHVCSSLGNFTVDAKPILGAVVQHPSGQRVRIIADALGLPSPYRADDGRSVDTGHPLSDVRLLGACIDAILGGRTGELEAMG